MQNKDQKSHLKKLSPQTNYSFLTSTNRLYRDQLPPEYRLPTLIGSECTADLRGINNIDNEEQIPELDFKDALAKFNIKTSDGIECNGKDDKYKIPFISDNSQIRKTYSENEVSKYDADYGRRKSQHNPNINNLAFKWGPDYHHEVNKRILPKSERIKDGINDEYIPNFATFNLAKFGIDENAIDDDDEDDDEAGDIKQFTKTDVNDSFSHLLTTKTKAKPIVIGEKASEKNNDNFEVSDESFKRANSPERNEDRKILASIPKNFSSLSFSYRRKMLTDLLPDNLKNNTEYKNHIVKIIKKNSASTSASSSLSSNIFFAKRTPKKIEPDTNEMGSILLGTWRLGRVFNNGSFGIIRECFNVNDLDNVKAVKIIPLNKSFKCLENYKSEIIMWSKLKNECIVPLHDLKITTDYIFLLMPLYDEGSLFDRVKFWETNRVDFLERYTTIISYIKCVTEAIKYLHENNIHHGDIKLENFLLDDNKPKLCDFGMTNYDKNPTTRMLENVNTKIQNEIQSACKLLSKNSSCSLSTSAESDISDPITGPMSGLKESTTCDTKTETTGNNCNNTDFKEHHINIGSLPYAAPELLKPCPSLVDCKADLWAFGILIYALVLLKLPFWHIYEPRLKLSILEGNWESEEWHVLKNEHREMALLDKLVSGCLTDRKSRLSIFDISDLLNTMTI